MEEGFFCQACGTVYDDVMACRTCQPKIHAKIMSIGEEKTYKTLVFCKGQAQYLGYCEWKGLDPEKDASMELDGSVAGVKRICEFGRGPVPAEYIVILPGARSLSKKAREIVTDAYR
jgi:hypothetical protein